MRFDSSSRLFFAHWRLALVAAAAVTLAACSAIRFGYNHADTVLLYSLNDYVSLNGDQEFTLRKRVNAVHDWHRQTQVADYAAFLREAQAKVNGGPVTADDVLRFNEGLNTRLMTVGERAAPDIAHFALMLTPAQIEQLERKLSKDARKARNDEAAPLAQRVKKYGERAEHWFGKLTPEQLDIVRSALAQQGAHATYPADEKERRQRELMAVVRKIHQERPSEETATRWVRQYFAGLAQPTDPARKARAESYRQQRAALIAELVNSATPQQRAQLNRRLGGYADEFAALAPRGGSRQAATRGGPG